MICPLCHHDTCELFFTDSSREYYRCGRCRLVHVPCRFHLDSSEEKRRYDTHQNIPSDAGYRAFLSRLARPLQAVVPTGAHGLDFGSGPGPTLSVILEEEGYRMDIYDRYYAHVPERLARSYDFITASEVVEHLHEPGMELDRLWSCLRPGGIMGIMTKLVLDQKAFSTWHYIRDLTHISFFSRPTFTWLATRWDAGLNFVDKDVVLVYKKSLENDSSTIQCS